MKHIFTLLAAISLLICVFLVALTVMTLNGEKNFDLGQRGERTYSFKADSLEFVYQGKLTTFDNVLGFKTEKNSFAGIECDKQIRQQTKTLSAATGFVVVIPALYPIALFAILPLVWLIGRFRKNSNNAGFEAASDDNAPPTRA